MPASQRIMTVAAVVAAITTGSALACNQLTINEIRTDQPGEDINEYVEIIGPAGGSLDSLTYIVIGDSGTAGSGVIEMALDLTGKQLDAQGLFLISEATFTLGNPDMVATLDFENDDNVTHLVVLEFTGFEGQDLDTNDDGEIDLLPWDAVVCGVAIVGPGTPGVNGDYVYTTEIAGPNGSFVPGHIWRCEDDWNIGQFDTVDGDDTPGAHNPCFDFNQDGVVNVVDFLQLLGAWGECQCVEDHNLDGMVDVVDLLGLFAAWD